MARLILLPLLVALAAYRRREDEEADVGEVVGDFVEATNERDADTLCGELLTQEYKEVDRRHRRAGNRGLQAAARPDARPAAGADLGRRRR